MASATSKSPKAEFITGVKAGLPFVLIVAPFGVLFGVLAAEAGMDFAQLMAMTFLVVAGAAQFTALQLMLDNAPLLVVIATSLAVNLRMAMYSASLVPHLGDAPLWKRACAAYLLVDQSFTVAVTEYETRTGMTTAQKYAFFFGAISPIVPVWYISCLVGALLGQEIPPGYALDFAIPIAFVAIIAPGLRTLAHVAAALVAVTLSLLLAWMPYSAGVIVAGMAGMTAGAEVERRMGRNTG